MRLLNRLNPWFAFGLTVIYLYILTLLFMKFLNYRVWYNKRSTLQYSVVNTLNSDFNDLCKPPTINRGFNQRIIAVSLFGPTENFLFQSNLSLVFLIDLIQNVHNVYPGWILRVYHDNTIDTKSLRQLQCRYDYVDFYNMTGKSFPLPRMWRFLPVGDTLVDIMISRDLDSPLTYRERAAVDDWLTSDKILHIMRDHPLHYELILAGMWGFRPAFNRKLSQFIFDKLQNATIMKEYVGNGDQRFLLNELWPFVRNNSITHDSFHCQLFQDNSKPFPTRRPIVNGSNIFVGCVKPCTQNQFPFGECPIECRPTNNREWIYC